VLATSLALALDPVRLARAAGVEPDPWQADVLRSTERQLIQLCARQTGKSLISALLALHEALFQAPALVLLLAPALRQSQELFRKVKMLLALLGELIPPITEESALRLELGNGSRIISLPGKEGTIRGYSNVSLLAVDEASRVPDDLYLAIRPMLAISGGRIVLLSTPCGRRGFFHQEWTAGGPDWGRVKITARECPRISPAFLAAERRAIPARIYRQEYECSFEAIEDQVFSYEVIERAFRDDVRPLFGSEAA
jgi:hypothetical protein